MDERKLIRRESLDILSKRTRNFQDVVERLEEYDVLTPSEIKHLNCCSDEETSISMLYSIILQKPTSNLSLLFYVLQDTDNDELARYLQQSLKNGELVLQENVPKDSEGGYVEQRNHDIDLLPITGGEMGIAELLEECTELTKNWKELFNYMRLPNSCLAKYKYERNFVMQATLILRDWSVHLKERATVGNFCNILENQEHKHCTGRIRRMFGRHIDSGHGFGFPQSGSFTIKGKIGVIASILDNNPSFCFHPERLHLMLNLPLDSLSTFVQAGQGTGTGASFPSVAEKMLSLWLQVGAASASTDHLASLLSLNGHFHSSNKVAAL